jgi:8-oxo-dGTP diphosphatase
LGFDAAVLGPVLTTATHPDALPLGWQQFAQLVAQAALPVYAIGGVSPVQSPQAMAHGAVGVAGIRAFWPQLPNAQAHRRICRSEA